MQLKLVIAFVASVLFMFTLDAAEARKRGVIRRGNQTNVCTNNRHGLPPTGGKQITTGSCSTTIQGEIPSEKHMPSTIIVSPENGSTISAKKTFDIEVEVEGVETGHFSNPETQYYTEPQCLNDKGFIVGHLHVVVQEITKPKAPLDPTVFQFFEGLNDPGTRVGHRASSLTATVDGGLLPGHYRLCTLGGTDSHQPWIMPVAKRGSQDDCIRFNVR